MIEDSKGRIAKIAQAQREMLEREAAKRRASGAPPTVTVDVLVTDVLRCDECGHGEPGTEDGVVAMDDHLLIAHDAAWGQSILR